MHSAPRREALLSTLAILVAAIALVLLAGCAQGRTPGPADTALPSSGNSPAAVRSAPASVSAAAVPSHAAVSVATSYLRRWGHISALAVIDSRGRLFGFHAQRRFASASVVKAMLLTEYVRAHRRITPGMRAELWRMIVLSDNAATDRVFGVVGEVGLRRLAAAAGMRSFVPASPWALTQTTAADQVRFFAAMDELVPIPHRQLVRALLSAFGPYRGWGIPRLAVRYGWRPFFKDGWIHTPRGESLLQVVRLERGRQIITIAVFANGLPTSGYGVHLIREVGWLLLHRSAKRGG